MQLLNSQNTPENASESVSYLPEIRFRPGGFAPLVPLPGLCPGPTGGLGDPHTPCLLCFHIVQGLATPLLEVVSQWVEKVIAKSSEYRNQRYVDFVAILIYTSRLP